MIRLVKERVASLEQYIDYGRLPIKVAACPTWGMDMRASQTYCSQYLFVMRPAILRREKSSCRPLELLVRVRRSFEFGD